MTIAFILVANVLVQLCSSLFEPADDPRKAARPMEGRALIPHLRICAETAN